MKKKAKVRVALRHRVTGKVLGETSVDIEFDRRVNNTNVFVWIDSFDLDSPNAFDIRGSGQ